MVQFSHLYMTTGKIIALTVQILFGEVLSLLFHMLSKFVIAFPSRSKCLLISWLQTPSTVILEHKKIKSVTVSNFSSSICHEVVLVFFSIFQIPYSSLYKLKHYFCLVVILWFKYLNAFYVSLSKVFINHHVFSCVSHVRLFAIPWTIVCQAPLSMGFPPARYWSQLPCPPLGDLPYSGIEPVSPETPTLASRFFTCWATWEAHINHHKSTKMSTNISIF